LTTVGILLAAGASRRFGAADKLLATLDGRPLVAHSGAALSGAGCDRLIAVTTAPEVAALLPDFDIVGPEARQPLQSDSIRAGIARARQLGAKKALVALADMPFVTSRHLRDVLDRSAGSTPSASTDGTRRMPPACFPSEVFEKLLALSADAGAQAILAALPEEALVLADKSELRDIDTPDDLAALGESSFPGRALPRTEGPRHR
jgi:molybdenum cofactor cytidylyltransferase